MRAKILFITEKTRHLERIRLMEQALSELAIAFGHSFAMRTYQGDQADIRQDAAAVAAQQDAVLLIGSAGFLNEAALGLACHAGWLPPKNQVASKDLSRLKDGAAPDLHVVWPLSENTSALGKTAVTACALAKRLGKRLWFIPPENESSWDNALNRAAMYAALEAPQAVSLETVVNQMLYQPDALPVLMAGAEIGRSAAIYAHFLSGTDSLAHPASIADTQQYPAAQARDELVEVPLFSLLYATADLLDNQLGLEQEGDCLRSAIDNVLASGWRTAEFGLGEKTIAPDAVLDLIVNQVQLAGELFERLKPQ